MTNTDTANEPDTRNRAVQSAKRSRYNPRGSRNRISVANWLSRRKGEEQQDKQIEMTAEAVESHREERT